MSCFLKGGFLNTDFAEGEIYELFDSSGQIFCRGDFAVLVDFLEENLDWKLRINNNEFWRWREGTPGILKNTGFYFKGGLNSDLSVGLLRIFFWNQVLKNIKNNKYRGYGLRLFRLND
jgi:hypothetical protein